MLTQLAPAAKLLNLPPWQTAMHRAMDSLLAQAKPAMLMPAESPLQLTGYIAGPQESPPALLLKLLVTPSYPTIFVKAFTIDPIDVHDNISITVTEEHAAFFDEDGPDWPAFARVLSLKYDQAVAVTARLGETDVWSPLLWLNWQD
jgi:hypothetical protein